MTTPRWLSIAVLLLCACPGDDDGTTGNDTGSSSTAPTTSVTTTEASSESSTSPSTTDASTSTGDPDSSSGGESSETMAADSSSSTSEPVAFELTSTAFAEGEGIPGVHHVNGGNESPPLDWVGAPAGTMSYAVFFHDITIDFEHSAIWNIPADATGLPQDVDHDAMPADVPGAVQCQSWIDEYGYGGPGSPANFYQFTLYAIDVAEIPDTEIDSESSLVEVRAAFEAHSLGTATLSGQSTGP